MHFVTLINYPFLAIIYTVLTVKKCMRKLCFKLSRITLAMSYGIDVAVETIRQALEDSAMLNETVFVFASDNGANPTDGASNYPLRGGKDTLWEGGVRVPAFLYSPLFEQQYGGQINTW